MDRRKEFILQCEKAVEIQELFKKERLRPSIFNPILCFCYGYVIPEELEEEENYELVINEEELSDITSAGSPYDDWHWIWLPTQSQLQEMVNIKNPYELIGIFTEWNDYEVKLFNSMEQLWLAFVMKELYNKIWNGNEWINENRTRGKK